MLQCFGILPTLEGLMSVVFPWQWFLICSHAVAYSFCLKGTSPGGYPLSHQFTWKTYFSIRQAAGSAERIRNTWWMCFPTFWVVKICQDRKCYWGRPARTSSAQARRKILQWEHKFHDINLTKSVGHAKQIEFSWSFHPQSYNRHEDNTIEKRVRENML